VVKRKVTRNGTERVSKISTNYSTRHKNQKMQTPTPDRRPSSITSSQALGQAICQVLGLDGNKISKMTIELNPGEVASIQVVHCLSELDAKGIVGAISKYTLEPKSCAVSEVEGK